jgi:hypothetical protein
MAGTGAPAYATLDGTATNVTLSNGNLTATHSNTSTNSGAVSTAMKGTGKRYFEATFTTTPSAGDGIGILLSSGTFTDMISVGSNTSVQFAGSGGIIYSNGGSSGMSTGAIANGDKISAAIDLDNRRGWFRRNGGNWNGSGTANPATNTGGFTIQSGSFAPAVGFTTGGSGNSVTLNLGATAFTYTVPAGFTSGWPT